MSSQRLFSRDTASQGFTSSAMPTPLTGTRATLDAFRSPAQRAKSLPILCDVVEDAQTLSDAETECSASNDAISLPHDIASESAILTLKNNSRNPLSAPTKTMHGKGGPAVHPTTIVQSLRAARDASRFVASMDRPFMRAERPARILCVARRHERKNKYVDFVGEHHLDLIQEFNGMPVIVPRTVRTLASLVEYLPMDGLLVVEGSDISEEVLSKYKCALPSRLTADVAGKFASDTEVDVSKDELECELMRYALLSGCPVLGLCRGSQMLNVLHGGTLYSDIGTEVSTEIEHLQPAGQTYDSFRHPIHVAGNTPLSDMFCESIDAEAGGELQVNSYHHQAVKELGKGLKEMAWAPDGVLEAFYDPSYEPDAGKFVVGLQFHPERMLDDYPGCKKVYESFLTACTAFRRRECESAQGL
eukprot:TRINITY_DN2732_c0_g1_i1.p1 TRINITY_DN2732_c0_g1~~TRINITY_DN2732_c0_g1_i1.p1  ORF type:complete len:417 (-),score=57.87 TRINITY_DN2732_c0_g1_i1:323-1573(-)